MDTLEWIKRNYSAVIERDPSFSEVMPVPVHVFSCVLCVLMLYFTVQYMDKIGVVYCGVTPDKKPEGGLEGIFGELAITVDI